MDDEIEYLYRVDEMTDEGVATVTYMPDDRRLKHVTLKVSVPVEKARDLAHAQEIMEKKIRSRAPQDQWLRALKLLEDEAAGVVRPDPKELVSTLRRGEVGQERRVEKPQRMTREERLRRDFIAE